LDTADNQERPRFHAAGVHARDLHPAAQHDRQHPGDDLLGVGDHLVLARRGIGHHEAVRLGFGCHGVDVDPDDLPGEVVTVQVRRQRGSHIRDQRGLREAHHHRGGEIVLIDEIAIQHGFGHADLGGDLVHADITSLPADGVQCAVDQLGSPFHLVLVPASFAPVCLRGFGCDAGFDGVHHLRCPES
jgi:hypothetical protein